ncbi:MAG: hypothetical protein DRJ05_05900 [Bacteroidetes bacterium]|nr:MAG: hypothetical protein DRJ05_05900 [Bacteroidota bacterium]
MKKFTLISVVIAFFLMTGISNAQNVAISDVAHTADASAVLDVYSTSLGMLVPRMATAPSSPANGLFYYDSGSNSFKYNAGTSGTPSWTELSYGSLWSRSGTDTYLSNSGDDVGIGFTSPSHMLHISDPLGVAATQLQIDNGAGAGNSSMGFDFAGTTFSQGIFGATGDYEMCATPGLVPSTQSDGSTILRSFPSGIVDLNNQSRARAFQGQNPNLPPGMGQIIPFSVWTPVDFEITNYDEQGEFTLHPMGMPYSGGGGPAAAFFTATEDGYYQVNARTNFLLWDIETLEEIHFPVYPGFVSIGIVVTDASGTTYMYAQGNKLQGSDNNGMEQWNDLHNNLAPNVSDVVFLKKGETIEIWVWQDLWTQGLPLEVGPRFDPGFMVPVPMQSQTYVSVHKSS